MSEIIPTQEELDRHFSAMGDSVDLINGYVAGSYQGRTIVKNDEATDCVKRNVEHLKIMRDKPWWTGYELAAVNAAITAGSAY